MKNFWEVILPNKIVYTRGKKAEVLIRYPIVVKMTRINEKQLLDIIEQGVTKI